MCVCAIYIYLKKQRSASGHACMLFVHRTYKPPFSKVGALLPLLFNADVKGTFENLRKFSKVSTLVQSAYTVTIEKTFENLCPCDYWAFAQILKRTLQATIL